MPLGLMPGMRYEEFEDRLAPAESLLFYSAGLMEAHSPQHEMFGFLRLKALLAQRSSTPADTSPTAGNAQSAAGEHDEAALVGSVLSALRGFAGESWEQEDDVTLVALRRLPAAPPA